MKLRTKPREYEAVVFKDEISCHHKTSVFIGSGAVIKTHKPFTITALSGTRVLKDGDILYKLDGGFVEVASIDSNRDEYFEVIE